MLLLFFLAKNVLPKLATKANSFVLDKFERKISGEGTVRAGKGFTLFISNEDLNNIIKIKEPLEKSGLLIDGTTESIKHEIKKTRRWTSWSFDSAYGCFTDSIYGFFIDTFSCFFIDKCSHWKRTRRWIFSIISITFNHKSSGKRRHEQEENIITWIKIFSPSSSFYQYRDYKVFQP